LVEKAVYDKGKNGEKSVRAVRTDVNRWKEFIECAQKVYESLLEEIELYYFSWDSLSTY